MSVWTSDELRALLDAISDHYLYPLYLLAATTGMRRAEIAGLVWRSVDLYTAQLTVSQQLLSVEYTLIESGLKTPTSRRTIDLDPHTVNQLRLHRRRQLVFRYRVKPDDLDSDGIAVASAATGDDGAPTHGFTGAINAAGTDVPIDYAHPGLSPVSDQKVDGRPYIQGTRIVSTPEAGMGAYRANEIIEVAFTFDTRVVVDGDVCAHLFLGLRGKDTLSARRRAAYQSGSGTDTLTFGYTVRPGDKDSTGIMVSPISDRFSPCGSGTIKAEGTDVEYNPSFDGTGHHSGHKVDTRSPAASSVAITSRPANGEAYTADETIHVEVAFNEKVVALGDPYIELRIGEQTRRAAPAADQGLTASLAFGYQVQSSDADDDGVAIDANSVRHSDGDIHDRAGNTANLSYSAVTADPNQRIAPA